MRFATQEISFNGTFLRRGFWLYVWEIVTSQGMHLYYVGRTGDSSSVNAQSPFNRMGQHLSVNNRANPLRRYLKAEAVDLSACSFRLISCGPILEEALTLEEHRQRRDRVGAMEKALATAMASAGYRVMNTVSCRSGVDESMFAGVKKAFARHFDKLASNA